MLTFSDNFMEAGQQNTRAQILFDVGWAGRKFQTGLLGLMKNLVGEK